MTLNLSLPQDPFDIRPKITVVGVGGAGGNAVNNMIRSKLEGVDFLVANTDAQALQGSLCERRIQTVGVVTKPFHFEGSHRMKMAEYGITELQNYVDTLIIIPNQNLFRIANEKTTF